MFSSTRRCSTSVLLFDWLCMFSLHEPALMRSCVIVFNRSKVPSAFTGYSFHVIEALIVFANEVSDDAGCSDRMNTEIFLLDEGIKLFGGRMRGFGAWEEDGRNEQPMG